MNTVYQWGQLPVGFHKQPSPAALPGSLQYTLGAYHTYSSSVCSSKPIVFLCSSQYLWSLVRSVAVHPAMIGIIPKVGIHSYECCGILF